MIKTGGIKLIMDHFKFDFDFVRKKKLNFNKLYRSWHGALLERTMNIFKWNGLPMPQKEIEILLTYVGFCGFTRFKKSKELGAVNGSMTGVTNYPDEFTRFVYATPLESGIKTIGGDLILINNNQIRMPTIFIVQNYATLLAHTDLSLQTALINYRATDLVKATNQQQVEDINKWYNAMENGKTMAVLDSQNFESLMGDEGLKVFSLSQSVHVTLDAYYQVRENLLKSFYSEIGINSMRDKRERVVEAELDTNLNRILFNVDDMLDCRKTACEEINKIFGTKVSVELNREIVNQIQVSEGSESNDNADQATES